MDPLAEAEPREGHGVRINMEDACPGLRAAMSEPWGGGAYGEVIASGVIKTGDVVSWDEAT
jgi:MOSC domain-containing protein YiiM